MSTFLTSSWLTTHISDFCLAYGIDEKLVCHCLECTEDRAQQILLAEGVNTLALAEFERIHRFFTSVHTELISETLPDLNMKSFSFYPVSVDLKLGDSRAVVYCTGTISAKITNSKQLASRFVLLYKEQKIIFYVIQGLYPWIFVEGKDKYLQQNLNIANHTRAVIKIASSDSKTVNRRAKLVATYYNRIAVAVEQIQKFCCAENNMLHKLEGSSLELHRVTNYPETHKSPRGHIRKAHTRILPSGKRILIRETVVAGSK